MGISTFLANFEADLADDGLINNSPGFTETVRSQIDKAAAAVNFGTVATNLNSFYKSTGYVGGNMLQWVDSSGGGDRVINRYKFTGTGVIGTRSQSPAYAAGSDDIGQCMSVSTGTLSVGGVATSAKTVKAAAGNTFSIGLLPTVAGSLAGYLQRSAPNSAGVCPTTVPAMGLTRVVKYSIQAPASIGGTITGLGTGKSITLTNNGDDALTRTEDGAFTFATKLAAGAAYSVAVSSQPGGQTCAVASATGTATTNVTNIDITCASITQKPASLLILDGLTDSSINRAPLTFYGTATTKTVKDPWGNSSPVMVFDGGEKSYVTVPFTTAFGTGDFTIDMWFNTAGATVSGCFQSLISDWANVTGPFNLQLCGAVLNANISTSPPRPWAGNGQAMVKNLVWQHFAVTRNAGTFNYWVDGKLSFSDSGGLAGSVLPATGILYIGHSDAGSYAAYTGYITGVRIIPGYALYSAPFTPPASLSSYKRYYP